MAKTILTDLEAKVLDACWNSALDSTGGDFACLDEVSVPGVGRKALGGVVTSLENKRVIAVDVTYVNGSYRSKGTKVVQITFPAETLEAFELTREGK